LRGEKRQLQQPLFRKLLLTNRGLHEFRERLRSFLFGREGDLDQLRERLAAILVRIRTPAMPELELRLAQGVQDTT
jgi:hypothetical protein